MIQPPLNKVSLFFDGIIQTPTRVLSHKVVHPSGIGVKFFGVDFQNIKNERTGY